MIRRYCLAVVGVILMAGLLLAIVRVAPWTLRIIEPTNTYGADIVMHKLIGVVGVIILLALVGFMALGERIGIIAPPKSDVISIFGHDDTSGESVVREVDAAASAPTGSLNGSVGMRSYRTSRISSCSEPPGARSQTESPGRDFISARANGDIQLMWFRSRSISSRPTMRATRSTPASLE